MNEQIIEIFYQMNGRMPTVVEAEDFAESVVLINQFSIQETPEELRQTEVEELLEGNAELIDIDEIYTRFDKMVSSIRLDTLAQSAVFYWRVEGDYYADSLDRLERIS